jgi:hypothetical protein
MDSGPPYLELVGVGGEVCLQSLRVEDLTWTAVIGGSVSLSTRMYHVGTRAYGREMARPVKVGSKA